MDMAQVPSPAAAQAIDDFQKALNKYREDKAQRPDPVTAYCDEQAKKRGYFVTEPSVEVALMAALELAKEAQKLGPDCIPTGKQLRLISLQGLGAQAVIERVAPQLAKPVAS